MAEILMGIGTRSDVSSPGPYFSIVVPTFNRASIIERCIRSCLVQNFGDREVIVVDDGSTDDTSAALRRVSDPCLTVVALPKNRGHQAAKSVGVKQACGKWILIVDSDFELLSCALERLHEITRKLPLEIGLVRARLRWDDGHITPTFVPDKPVGYEERIVWVESEGGSDALMCFRRQLRDSIQIYDPVRRTSDLLHQLDLGRATKSLYVTDVLGLEHEDGPDSMTRSCSWTGMQKYKARATDMLWMYETCLERHGEALRTCGPKQYARLLMGAALQSFYGGKRLLGTRYMLQYLRRRPDDVVAWLIIALGAMGSRAALFGLYVKRNLGK